MDELVKQVIEPFLKEANSKIKKVVGIYGGRFQPFGPHHKKVYEWLKSQFDDAYITTSNIKKPPKHPMNYKEKVRHMTKMGIPSSKISLEKSPFVAKNLAKKFDEETTAFVYIFGKKDTGRLGGGKYFQDYKKNKKNLKGHEEHGYYLVAPHMSVSAGGQEVSGTAMRQLLGSPGIDDKRRVKLFKKMFGYFDKGMFQMMTNKFKKLFGEDVDWVFKPTKMKKLKKKWDDDKGVELLKGQIKEKVNLKKIFQKLKIPSTLLKNQKKLIDYFRINPQILSQFLVLIGENGVNENIKLPIKIGDTVRMGKFKNKKVVIKKIEWNEKGDLLINGRPAMKFRLEPKPNIFDEDTIKEFLKTIDMYKIITEVTATAAQGKSMVDDGPNAFMGGMGGYKGRNKYEAEKLGWNVINYIVNVDIDNVPPNEFEMLDGWPIGPHNSVSYFPAGVGKGKTANNQSNLTGEAAYDKWLKAITSVAQEVGFELIKFMKRDKYQDFKKQMAKDSTDTLIQQKKEVHENALSKAWWKEHLITEGGAYGHMAHPFDDSDLTFGDLKKIIELGLGGTLSREDGVTEKLDGQNIMISWKDGKLIAARNKGHIKNGGKTALSTSGIASKFSGRGEIKKAFVFAMKDLEKAIGSLSEKQRVKIFDNGHNFMNMEVMWPASANVIDYDVANLVFHGALKYDDKGNVKGEVPGSARILAGMIQQINQHIQNKYKIGKPVFLDVPKHQDFGKMKAKFLSRLNKLESQFGLKDSDTLGLYHQKWWEKFIHSHMDGVVDYGGKTYSNIHKGLTKRWAFFDKSYKVPQIKKDIEDEVFLDWVLKFDKKDHAPQVKKNMKPFEELFFEVGAEILKNVQGFMAVNPNKAVQGIRKRLDKAISNVRKGGDLKKLNTLKLQLDKLNAIGGTNAIVPSEGLVFKYKGKTYKFTGAFAPVNQITGLINF